jgi:4-amino-4-deoxy-L-arabinose transferase-like glycosyltransferase
MTAFLSGVINPDAMLIALWTLSGWLGTSIIKRGIGFRRAAGLCLCVGVALATKAPALALLPPFAFVLALAAWRGRRRLTRRALVPIAVAALLFLVPVVSWYEVSKSTGNGAYSQVQQVSKNASSGGGANPAGGGAEAHGSGIRSPSANEFASYLWQYYLPKLPFQHDIRFLFPVISHNAAFQNWIGGGWANFGWANVWFPRGVYRVFGITAALLLLAALSTGFRALRIRRREGSRFGVTRSDLVLPAFFLLLSGGLVAGLHWTDFHMYLTHSAPFLQGRYLLPLGALFSLVLAQSTQAVPARFRGAAAGAVIGGLVVLQLACLGLIVSRYYA